MFATDVVSPNQLYLGHDWFKCSAVAGVCGCGVAVSSGFKRFVRLVLRLEIGAYYD